MEILIYTPISVIIIGVLAFIGYKTSKDKDNKKK